MALRNVPKLDDLYEFRSIIGRQNDGAKVAKYITRINGLQNIIDIRVSEAKELSFLCEMAELPGRAITVEPAHYYGPEFKTPVISAYNDMNLTFICRNKMFERKIFDDWMEVIQPKNNYDFKYREDYETTINIYTLNEALEATYMTELRHAFPIYVNPQPLAWAEDNYHRLQVTFSYVDWIAESNE